VHQEEIMHVIRLNGEDVSVGKIIGIGRNYVAHARELGNPMPDAPILFMKPPTAILGNGDVVRIPAYSQDCHHEVELAVLIGTGGKDIPEHQALGHVAGYGVALDLTLRDVQTVQKENGLPWEIAKGFDTSCPLSDFTAAKNIQDPQALELQLKINGELRQTGTTADMQRTVACLIAVSSTYFTLERGDILLTGTPEGVGPIKSGDRLEAEIRGVGQLTVTVA
jgi:5-carboxymethyl-2-hydroxymuconate isomerase